MLFIGEHIELLSLQRGAILRLCLLVTISVLMISCGNARLFVKTYEGPALKPDSSALVKPFFGIQIKSINGDTSKAINPSRPGHFDNLDVDISLIPGIHIFRVGYYVDRATFVMRSLEDRTVQLEAKAGRRYVIRVKEIGMQWFPYFEDVTNTPEKWCWSEWTCKNGPSPPFSESQLR